MMPLNLKSLVGHLNDTCRRSLEAAAGLCLSRTHYNVEIEHFLIKLIEVPNSDIQAICRKYEINQSRLMHDISAVIERFKTGNSRSPALAPNLVDLIREAWVLASVEYNASEIRSGHLLATLLCDDSLSRISHDITSELAKITPETLRRDLVGATAQSAEAQSSGATDGSVAGPSRPLPAGGSSTSSLDQFTVDLTAAARAGKIDPILGRDHEIRQVIDILTRRRQNNPILTGEAGVGKTAVVEGFALRIAAGDVPQSLKNVSLRTLDLALLQAGAGIKGEFENRLKSVISDVKSSPQPIILFIDEAHTMIGAGGQAGQNDAANLLKPALARGELRTIAATTWAEFKKYFERDAALARRFQVVKVEEPSVELGIQMMNGLVGTLEKHHEVRILDEAVQAAVKLSTRYISGRQLPDKAVSLLDTACARVALGLNAVPPALEDGRRRIEHLQTSISICVREQATGSDHRERLDELRAVKQKTEQETVALESRWQSELRLVQQARQIRDQIESQTAVKNDDNGREPVPPTLDENECRRLLGELNELTQQLKQIQGDKPLVPVCVDGQAVAEVVANWTGIPVGRMVADEIRVVMSLRERMEERIVGQSHALEAISQRIRMARANLTDPRRPIAVFLFVGSSGVGKTETAVTLAELLYGGDQNMTVINMSEFKEEHKVSLLMGSPPGYVGYGEGGVLTEAVRRRPYSVVLLDELEKAHPGVQDIFYQVFDKGTLRDGEGRDIDFKNTVIIMTSNAATDLVVKLCADPDVRPDPEALAAALHPELLKTFKPAFLGRVSVIPYYPLSDEVMRSIVELQLKRIAQRVLDNYRAVFTYDPAVVVGIAERCKEVDTGARNVDHILNRALLPELAGEFLARIGEGNAIRNVHLGWSEEGRFRYTIS